VISSKNGKLRSYGVNPVDGDLQSLNSFRAELEAIRSPLYWLRLLIKVFSFTFPSEWYVVIWIDNSSALKYSKLDDFFKPNQHIGNESNIINDIFAVKNKLQISLRGKHVKGHQTLERNVRAPLEVQLNEGCDGHADDFLKHSPAQWHSVSTASIPATAKATLIIKGAVITNNYLKRLTDAWSTIKMRTYISRREKAGMTKPVNPSTGITSRLLLPKPSNRERPTSHATSSS
jgi:hypothetical protein